MIEVIAAVLELRSTSGSNRKNVRRCDSDTIVVARHVFCGCI